MVTVIIFNNCYDSNEYAIVTVKINDGTNYNSIDMQPMYDFVRSHSDIIVSYSYSQKYVDIDSEMLTAIGFTSQSLNGYNLDYYYKVDPLITENFLNAVHSCSAKYGTRNEEGDSIDIDFVEETIGFRPVQPHSKEVTHLTFIFNQDGWNYYFVNENEN